MAGDDAYQKAQTAARKLTKRAKELGVATSGEPRFQIDPWELRRLISNLQSWDGKYGSRSTNRKWRLLMVEVRQTLRRAQGCLRRQQQAQLVGEELPRPPTDASPPSGKHSPRQNTPRVRIVPTGLPGLGKR